MAVSRSAVAQHDRLHSNSETSSLLHVFIHISLAYAFEESVCYDSGKNSIGVSYSRYFKFTVCDSTAKDTH